jgi:hypothetical protein
MSRILAALASLVLSGLGLFLLLPDCASACTCGVPMGSPVEVAESALKDSSAVFSGEVIKIEKVGKEVTSSDNEKEIMPVPKITLRTSEVWKGPERETIAVYTAGYGTTIIDSVCGYPFEKGKDYLVYASKGSYGKQSLSVSLCSQTQQISEPDDLKEIRLADTSGIVPRNGVLGLAGLTATAAFLLMRRLLEIR